MTTATATATTAAATKPRRAPSRHLKYGSPGGTMVSLALWKEYEIANARANATYDLAIEEEAWARRSMRVRAKYTEPEPEPEFLSPLLNEYIERGVGG